MRPDLAVSSSRAFLVTTFFVFASSSSAFALEGKALFDKILGLGGLAGGNIEYSSITEQSPDSFVLQDVTITNKRGEKSSVAAMTVAGLKEAGEKLITFDSITFSDMSGTGKRNSKFSAAAMTVTDAVVPTIVWKKRENLSAEEKRQRVKFGNFTINDFQFEDDQGNGTIDAVAISGADIPLDFRYGPDADGTGDIADPLKLDLVSINGVNIERDNGTFTLGSFSIKDINFPTSLQAPVTDFLKVYSAISINEVDFSTAGSKVVGIERLSGTMDQPDDDGTFKQSSDVKGLYINLKSLPDPKARAAAQQLGYEKLTGSMTGNGSWNINTGRTTVDDLTLDVDDVASLKMVYVLDGYTKELAKKISEIQIEATKSNNPQAFFAILPELGKITVENMKIELVDDSITRKLLEFQAKNMGTDADGLAAGAPMMVGLGMANLKMPELTQMVADAVGKFLKKPGTLSVTVNPEKKVSILDIVTASQTNPQQIPQLLNVTVSASE